MPAGVREEFKDSWRYRKSKEIAWGLKVRQGSSFDFEHINMNVF